MLELHAAFEADGVSIADVRCRHGPGRGDLEHAQRSALVFVRRGSFTRSADGVEATLDPTLAYCVLAGQEQRFDHSDTQGDDCTAFFFTRSLLASLWGGEPTLPTRPVNVIPGIDLEHRLLLAACRYRDDGEHILENALGLAGRLLSSVSPERVASGRPATRNAHLALVDGVREALAAQYDYPLSELARDLAVSIYHLSRVFRQTTGHTIARHRMRLRAGAALERLAAGEDDLARLAADLGFSDQSHLGRVLKNLTGTSPGHARGLLASV